MSALCTIRNLPAGRECPAGQSGLEISGRVERKFTPGEIIYSEGSRIDGIYCLRAGRVAVMKRCGSVGDLMISVAEPGDLLGSTSVMIGDHYINGGVALSDVSACFIPRQSYMRLIHEHPEIVVRAMERLSRQIDRIESEMIG